MIQGRIGDMMFRILSRLGKYIISVAVVCIISYIAVVILRFVSEPSPVLRQPVKQKIYALSRAHDFGRDISPAKGDDNNLNDLQNLRKSLLRNTNDSSELKKQLYFDTLATKDSNTVNKYFESGTTSKVNSPKLLSTINRKNIDTTAAKAIDTKADGKTTPGIETPTPINEDVQNNLLTIARKMNFTLENVSGGPGEFGEAVRWERDNLTAGDQTEWDNGYTYAGYNVYVSDRIALRREIKDLRHPMCQNITYPPDLPQASVVIPYHKEALSALMRTVLSTLDRAPAHLLKEIILVDDFSESEQLLSPLDEFVKYLPKVHVIRNTEREGLMRSRMKGVMAATAPIVVIKDAHTEYMPGWLEPLLLTVHNNRTTIAITHVHVMSKDNFQIMKVSPTSVHIFDFSLRQVIYDIPDTVLQSRKSEIEHVPSPAMLGTEFAINKEFFLEIGGYDPGLEIWGGEEMELSFKTWMCGGSMVIVPCSCVVHLFRSANHRSYILNVQNDIRVAQVWLDKYKHDVYQRFGKAVEGLDIGNITSRQELRRRLSCKSFDWYLENVAPMVYVPRDMVAQGSIRSSFDDRCIKGRIYKLHQAENRIISAAPCSGRGLEQFWMYTQSGYIRKDSHCFYYVNGTDSLSQVDCTKHNDLQVWGLTTENTIVHRPSGKCLTLHEDKTQIIMEPCQAGHEQQQQRQQWRIEPRKSAPDF